MTVSGLGRAALKGASSKKGLGDSLPDTTGALASQLLQDKLITVTAKVRK